ncbi:8086_t:CDS:2, partial [Funneliformis geosporum]
MTFCIFGNRIYDPLNDGGNVIYDPVNNNGENTIYDPENNHENGIYDPGENEIYVGTGTGSDLHASRPKRIRSKVALFVYSKGAMGVAGYTKAMESKR